MPERMTAAPEGFLLVTIEGSLGLDLEVMPEA
jgi:hypothetical protein